MFTIGHIQCGNGPLMLGSNFKGLIPHPAGLGISLKEYVAVISTSADVCRSSSDSGADTGFRSGGGGGGGESR